MAEEANKSNSAFNIFESTVKFPKDVAIEIIWKSSWSFIAY